MACEGDGCGCDGCEEPKPAPCACRCRCEKAAPSPGTLEATDARATGADRAAWGPPLASGPLRPLARPVQRVATAVSASPAAAGPTPGPPAFGGTAGWAQGTTGPGGGPGGVAGGPLGLAAPAGTRSLPTRGLPPGRSPPPATQRVLPTFAGGVSRAPTYAPAMASPTAAALPGPPAPSRPARLPAGWVPESAGGASFDPAATGARAAALAGSGEPGDPATLLGPGAPSLTAPDAMRRVEPRPRRLRPPLAPPWTGALRIADPGPGAGGGAGPFLGDGVVRQSLRWTMPAQTDVQRPAATGALSWRPILPEASRRGDPVPRPAGWIDGAGRPGPWGASAVGAWPSKAGGGAGPAFTPASPLVAPSPYGAAEAASVAGSYARRGAYGPVVVPPSSAGNPNALAPPLVDARGLTPESAPAALAPPSHPAEGDGGAKALRPPTGPWGSAAAAAPPTSASVVTSPPLARDHYAPRRLPPGRESVLEQRQIPGSGGERDRARPGGFDKGMGARVPHGPGRASEGAPIPRTVLNRLATERVEDDALAKAMKSAGADEGNRGELYASQKQTTDTLLDSGSEGFSALKDAVDAASGDTSSRATETRAARAAERHARARRDRTRDQRSAARRLGNAGDPGRNAAARADAKKAQAAARKEKQAAKAYKKAVRLGTPAQVAAAEQKLKDARDEAVQAEAAAARTLLAAQFPEVDFEEPKTPPDTGNGSDGAGKGGGQGERSPTPEHSSSPAGTWPDCGDISYCYSCCCPTCDTGKTCQCEWAPVETGPATSGGGEAPDDGEDDPATEEGEGEGGGEEGGTAGKVGGKGAIDDRGAAPPDSGTPRDGEKRPEADAPTGGKDGEEPQRGGEEEEGEAGTSGPPIPGRKTVPGQLLTQGERAGHLLIWHAGSKQWVLLPPQIAQAIFDGSHYDMDRFVGLVEESLRRWGGMSYDLALGDVERFINSLAVPEEKAAQIRDSDYWNEQWNEGLLPIVKVGVYGIPIVGQAVAVGELISEVGKAYYDWKAGNISGRQFAWETGKATAVVLLARLLGKATRTLASRVGRPGTPRPRRTPSRTTPSPPTRRTVTQRFQRRGNDGVATRSVAPEGTAQVGPRQGNRVARSAPKGRPRSETTAQTAQRPVESPPASAVGSPAGRGLRKGSRVPGGPKGTPSDWTPSEAARRVDELKWESHGPQRHEGQVTPEQHARRVLDGVDPATGRPQIKFDKKLGRERPLLRKEYAKTSSSFTSNEAYAQAESAVRNSPGFASKSATGGKGFDVEMRLSDALGPGYRDHVFGVTRLDPRATLNTVDFTGGKVVAYYKRTASGGYRLESMYAAPR